MNGSALEQLKTSNLRYSSIIVNQNKRPKARTAKKQVIGALEASLNVMLFKLIRYVSDVLFLMLMNCINKLIITHSGLAYFNSVFIHKH
jgi:hypothetical protein